MTGYTALEPDRAERSQFQHKYADDYLYKDIE